MKCLFVNALSATNLSGRQVLCGHLAEILRTAGPDMRIVLLVHPGNRDLPELLAGEWGGPLPGNLEVHLAPAMTGRWLGRSIYEWFVLPSRITSARADALLSPSGTWMRNLPCPQFTMALNPWALIPSAIHGPGAKAKAMLQRHGYRLAVRHADGIAYGSGFMRDLYRHNAGGDEKSGAVVYPALSRREVEAMDAVLREPIPRDPMTVLCVSLMARHKDIGTLVGAMRHLVQDHGCPAKLRLVGGWADPAYRREIEELVHSSGLSHHVEFTGHVSRELLRRAYRTATVYCLLSRSESFGIPAVEAQWMGTPVVGTRGNAVPEICGAGGRYVDPGDARGAARLLHELLTDAASWQTLSVAASENARRFQYRTTSQPLLRMLGIADVEGRAA